MGVTTEKKAREPHKGNTHKNMHIHEYISNYITYMNENDVQHRRRKRQNITKVKGTDQTEARRLACADPRTFITLDGCIQVAKKLYGMLTTSYGVIPEDGYAQRTFNPNNVFNFDESLGYTVHWYEHDIWILIHITGTCMIHSILSLRCHYFMCAC